MDSHGKAKGEGKSLVNGDLRNIVHRRFAWNGERFCLDGEKPCVFGRRIRGREYGWEQQAFYWM